MGVASLILGILSIIIGIIPFCGYFAFVPALVGIGLGIGEIVIKSKKGQSKGMGVAGTILSAIAVVFIVFWTFVIGIAAFSSDDIDFDDYDLKDYNYYYKGNKI